MSDPPDPQRTPLPRGRSLSPSQQSSSLTEYLNALKKLHSSISVRDKHESPPDDTQGGAPPPPVPSPSPQSSSQTEYFDSLSEFHGGSSVRVKHESPPDYTQGGAAPPSVRSPSPPSSSFPDYVSQYLKEMHEIRQRRSTGLSGTGGVSLPDPYKSDMLPPPRGASLREIYPPGPRFTTYPPSLRVSDMLSRSGLRTSLDPMLGAPSGGTLLATAGPGDDDDIPDLVSDRSGDESCPEGYGENIVPKPPASAEEVMRQNLSQQVSEELQLSKIVVPSGPSFKPATALGLVRPGAKGPSTGFTSASANITKALKAAHHLHNPFRGRRALKQPKVSAVSMQRRKEAGARPPKVLKLCTKWEDYVNFEDPMFRDILRRKGQLPYDPNSGCIVPGLLSFGRLLRFGNLSRRHMRNDRFKAGIINFSGKNGVEKMFFLRSSGADMIVSLLFMHGRETLDSLLRRSNFDYVHHYVGQDGGQAREGWTSFHITRRGNSVIAGFSTRAVWDRGSGFEWDRNVDYTLESTPPFFTMWRQHLVSFCSGDGDPLNITRPGGDNVRRCNFEDLAVNEVLKDALLQQRWVAASGFRIDVEAYGEGSNIFERTTAAAEGSERMVGPSRLRHPQSNSDVITLIDHIVSAAVITGKISNDKKTEWMERLFNATRFELEEWADEWDVTDIVAAWQAGNQMPVNDLDLAPMQLPMPIKGTIQTNRSQILQEYAVKYAGMTEEQQEQAQTEAALAASMETINAAPIDPNPGKSQKRPETLFLPGYISLEGISEEDSSEWQLSDSSDDSDTKAGKSLSLQSPDVGRAPEEPPDSPVLGPPNAPQSSPNLTKNVKMEDVTEPSLQSPNYGDMIEEAAASVSSPAGTTDSAPSPSSILERKHALIKESIASLDFGMPTLPPGVTFADSFTNPFDGLEPQMLNAGMEIITQSSDAGGGSTEVPGSREHSPPGMIDSPSNLSEGAMERLAMELSMQSEDVGGGSAEVPGPVASAIGLPLSPLTLSPLDPHKDAEMKAVMEPSMQSSDLEQSQHSTIVVPKVVDPSADAAKGLLALSTCMDRYTSVGVKYQKAIIAHADLIVSQGSPRVPTITPALPEIEDSSANVGNPRHDVWNMDLYSADAAFGPETLQSRDGDIEMGMDEPTSAAMDEPASAAMDEPTSAAMDEPASATIDEDAEGDTPMGGDVPTPTAARTEPDGDTPMGGVDDPTPPVAGNYPGGDTPMAPIAYPTPAPETSEVSPREVKPPVGEDIEMGEADDKPDKEPSETLPRQAETAEGNLGHHIDPQDVAAAMKEQNKPKRGRGRSESSTAPTKGRISKLQNPNLRKRSSTRVALLESARQPEKEKAEKEKAEKEKAKKEKAAMAKAKREQAKMEKEEKEKEEKEKEKKEKKEKAAKAKAEKEKEKKEKAATAKAKREQAKKDKAEKEKAKKDATLGSDTLGPAPDAEDVSSPAKESGGKTADNPSTSQQHPTSEAPRLQPSMQTTVMAAPKSAEDEAMRNSQAASEVGGQMGSRKSSTPSVSQTEAAEDDDEDGSKWWKSCCTRDCCK